MNDNKFCSACKIKIDENNYKKDRTVCKKCYNKKKRKTNTTLQSTKQKSPMFQHMKIIAMSILAQVTLVKPITCSKYLKK